MTATESNTCSIPGCDRQSQTRGWCGAHYRRWQRHGDPMKGGPLRPPPLVPRGVKPTVDDLAKRSVRVGDCLVWTGVTQRFGYGRVGHRGRLLFVHRLAWEDANGPIPNGLCVLHRCDNPACFNPNHLFLGTLADNNRDRDEKGRSAKGSGNGFAKLDEEQVSEIKVRLASGETQASLAMEFAVNYRTISTIAVGRAWKHVP